MSTTKIHYEHLEDSILTNATSVTLADPTNSFGVQRKDNNNTVVVAGTALEQLGTGVYEYEFDDPAPNLQYRYFLRVISHGQTIYLERDGSMLPSDYVYDGRYASYTKLVQKYGKNAVIRWASVDGRLDAAATEDALQNAILDADAYVDTYLNGGPYILPFTDTYGIPRMIKDLATMLAGALLYEAQGIIDFDANGEPTNRMAGERRKAMLDLGRIKTARIRLVSDAGVDLLQSIGVPEAGDSVSDGYYFLYPSDGWKL